MPYLTDERKDQINPHIAPLLKFIKEDNAVDWRGDLNYIFTVICIEFFKRIKRYCSIHDILGALDGCGKEFYRRLAGKYEDKAIEKNGDVYPPDLV